MPAQNNSIQPCVDTDLDTKRKIVELFNANVRGRSPDTSESNVNHDGKGGHWLETQMGIAHNASNAPDLWGYEMKNITTSGKTTFGDWSPDYKIFNDNNYEISRDLFLQIFGKPNAQKGGRYSWSGEPSPKINNYNSFGQQLFVDEIGNIKVIYNFQEDKRVNKSSVVPEFLQQRNLLLAEWKMESLKEKLERKFNQKGWFQCLKDRDGLYSEIIFGPPITYETWLEGVKSGLIYFDSGMYQGNVRPYSQWRANNSFWHDMASGVS